MTNGQVFGFLAAPDRQLSLRAVSLALLKVRSLPEMTCEKLAKTLECSADTIRNASNEETLLGFDHIGRLLYFFPDETAPIRDLWERAGDQLTITDRIARIERDLAAIRKEAA